MERLKDKPFALIGINSDGDRETVRKLFDEHGVTWRNAIDGDSDGPWSTAWNVNSWPTVYVIDAKGVIRFRDIRDVEMETCVERLLKEMDPPK